MTTKQFNAAYEIIKRLQTAGYDAVIVGGAVRDTLLGVAVHDVDVATNALPAQTKDVFEKTVDIGIEHGTILVLDAKEPIEVTTYRTEGTYVDHRRPDQVDFVLDLAEDLRRRDFTINAMALRSKDELVDLYGGREDLEKRMIRAVGNANERFEEDALRMLRAVRFSGKLGFTVEDKTLQAIKSHAKDIQYVSIERIKAEFDQIVRSRNAIRAFELLKCTTLAQYLPGQFEGIDSWERFHAANSLEGWAFFSYLEKDPALLKRYRGSNKELQFVRNVLQAVNQLQAMTPVELFHFEEAVLEVAAKIYNVFFERLDIETLLHQKRQLPIQTMQQLAITGKDLLQWTAKKPGPWLKIVLDDVLRAVLTREIDNEAGQIKGWVEREYDER